MMNTHAFVNITTREVERLVESGDYEPPEGHEVVALAEQVRGWPAGLGALHCDSQGVLSFVDTRTLAEVKRDAVQQMAAAWQAERSAGATVGTKVVPTDSEAWTRYLVIKAMSSDGDLVDVPIPLADGTFELLTPAKAQALWTALKAMERSLLAKLRDRVQAINAATTAEQVAAIVW